MFNAGAIGVSIYFKLADRERMQTTMTKETVIVLSLLLVIPCLLNSALAGTDCIGYDENTEIIVSGTVLKPSSCEFRGLRCFTMESRSRVFHVVTAPAWFLERIHLNLRPGTIVRVVGSKFYSSDGSLYLMARSLKNIPAGRNIQFRDSKCRPVWSRRAVKRSSCMKIFFPGRSL